MKLIIITSMLLSVGAVAAPMATKTSLDEFFKDKTRIENPLELRDPFKSPQSRGQSRRRSDVRHKRGDGIYSNINQENLRDWNIYEIKVVGVMIGKERRAMIVRTADGPAPQGGGPAPQSNGRVVVIKEGSTIGPDNAEVKAILPGGIILVEKIINVYGQEEYLETVIPISR